jgi:hypothetical protein
MRRREAKVYSCRREKRAIDLWQYYIRQLPRYIVFDCGKIVKRLRIIFINEAAQTYIYGYVDTLDEGRDHGDTPEQYD